MPHIAGRPNIKPSDILAMKSNYKGCAPYKPASSTAPSSPAAMMMATVEHTTVHAQNNINNLSKNVPSATTYSNNCNNSNNYALANNASAASVDVRNNQPQPKSTKSNNQSSSRKNRRIGRQESRYTSGNFVFLNIFSFFSLYFLLFADMRSFIHYEKVAFLFLYRISLSKINSFTVVLISCLLQCIL